MKATRVETIVECEFGLDGGAMFGVVPKPLWERTNPPDDRNRIAMATRCLYLEIGDRRILVDAGMGTKWSDKDRDIYAIHHPRGILRDQLRARGIAPDAITDVVVTHLHFDHAGGLTTPGPDGPTPTFPGARHWIQRENWVWAHAPTVRDAGSYRVENFAALGGPHGVDVRLVDGHGAIFDGLEAIVSNGHTPGMQMLRFETDAHTVLYVADLIPTTGHVPVPYVMGYDVYPLTTCREKAEVLDNAVRHGWVLALEHDPANGFLRVRRRPDGRYEADAMSDSLDAI